MRVTECLIAGLRSRFPWAWIFALVLVELAAQSQEGVGSALAALASASSTDDIGLWTRHLGGLLCGAYGCLCAPLLMDSLVQDLSLEQLLRPRQQASGAVGASADGRRLLGLASPAGVAAVFSLALALRATTWALMAANAAAVPALLRLRISSYAWSAPVAVWLLSVVLVGTRFMVYAARQCRHEPLGVPNLDLGWFVLCVVVAVGSDMVVDNLVAPIDSQWTAAAVRGGIRLLGAVLAVGCYKQVFSPHISRARAMLWGEALDPVAGPSHS